MNKVLTCLHCFHFYLHFIENGNINQHWCHKYTQRACCLPGPRTAISWRWLLAPHGICFSSLHQSGQLKEKQCLPSFSSSNGYSWDVSTLTWYISSCIYTIFIYSFNIYWVNNCFLPGMAPDTEVSVENKTVMILPTGPFILGVRL